MAQFEAHLMVSSRVVDSKVLPFSLSIFSDKKDKMAIIMLKIRRFLFDMSPDVPAFKVLVLACDLKKNFELV